MEASKGDGHFAVKWIQAAFPIEAGQIGEPAQLRVDRSETSLPAYW